MLFFDELDRFSDRIALISEDGSEYSYRKLISLGDSLAEQIGERCLTFLFCSNTVESVMGYVGCMRHRILPVLLNTAIDHQLLVALMRNYHPKFCWLPASIADQVSGKQVWSYGSYILISTEYEQDYQLYPELGLLLTTSGSTGSPKLVRQSYRNIQSNTESIIEYLGIKDGDRAISTLPMSYTYGLSILNTHLAAGASEILTDTTLMDKLFWELLKKNNATTFGGVPYIYEMLKKLRFERMELPSLRYLTQAGGKLSAELSAEFSALCAKRGMKFIVMYGQTEATARMSWLPFEHAQDKAGSIGIAIPGGRFTLEDIDGSEIAAPEVAGELIYYGDNVTLGYAQSRFDLIKSDENDGILRTGDIAKRDSDGFYYIVGRKKRFLKIFGNRVNLDEVEGLLKKEGIDCACAGTDDCLKIFVTDPDMLGKVTEFIDHHTAISHSGFRVMVIDKIPRSESGKILYAELNNHD